MFERAMLLAAVRAETHRRATIRRLSAAALPKGVTVEAGEQGVTLSGRNLRRRMIDDASLRNFAR